MEAGSGICGRETVPNPLRRVHQKSLVSLVLRPNDAFRIAPRKHAFLRLTYNCLFEQFNRGWNKKKYDKRKARKIVTN